jgi:hypothetical protein
MGKRKLKKLLDPASPERAVYLMEIHSAAWREARIAAEALPEAKTNAYFDANKIADKAAAGAYDRAVAMLEAQREPELRRRLGKVTRKLSRYPAGARRAEFERKAQALEHQIQALHPQASTPRSSAIVASPFDAGSTQVQTLAPGGGSTTVAK